MISIKEVLQILQKSLPEAGVETVDLAEAHGRYLAETVAAPEPSPRYTNSAMDGYALRWSDVRKASEDNPVTLKIAGESRAGLPFGKKFISNEAVCISTGDMMRRSADTVVRIEDTRRVDEAEVTILSVRCKGQDVRHEGEEFCCGDELLCSGTKLSARQLALLASVGHQQVKVFVPRRIAILVTGSELASAAEKEIKSYQVRDSNSMMLKTALEESGAAVVSCLNVADVLQATIEAISLAFSQGVDFVLCSGGISVGDHDHVKEAAAKVGFNELFWRIRQKPGKPLYAAQKAGTYLFGLPGNPVSAYMCFTHYIRPLLYMVKGKGMTWNTITAMANRDIINKGKRTNFIRVKLAQRQGDLPQIIDIKKQGSHMLSSIVHADGYIILAPDARIQSGQKVNVFLF